MKLVNLTQGSDVWRPVPGYDDYEVSKEGAIRRARPGMGAVIGHILNLNRTKDGYLWFRTRTKAVRVHQAVAWAFIGPTPVGLQINHRDGNKTNNSADNLEYTTHYENMQHAYRTGLMPPRLKGEAHGRAKLNEAQVREIKQSSSGARPLAQLYGVSRSAIRMIRQGRNWRHVNG